MEHTHTCDIHSLSGYERVQAESSSLVAVSLVESVVSGMSRDWAQMVEGLIVSRSADV